jgi:hypothetical protein
VSLFVCVCVCVCVRSLSRVLTSEKSYTVGTRRQLDWRGDLIVFPVIYLTYETPAFAPIGWRLSLPNDHSFVDSPSTTRTKAAQPIIGLVLLKPKLRHQPVIMILSRNSLANLHEQTAWSFIHI